MTASNIGRADKKRKKKRSVTVNRVETKILATIVTNPGLLWYEIGARVYPGSTKSRVNLRGELFRELTGRGLSLTHGAITKLKECGLVRVDAGHRYYASVPR